MLSLHFQFSLNAHKHFVVGSKIVVQEKLYETLKEIGLEFYSELSFHALREQCKRIQFYN